MWNCEEKSTTMYMFQQSMLDRYIATFNIGFPAQLDFVKIASNLMILSFNFERI